LNPSSNESVIRVAIAQINCTVGDLEGNAEKIFNAAREAASRRADILVTPELALTGYPPEDLLLRPALYARSDRALAALVARLAAFDQLLDFATGGFDVLEVGAHRVVDLAAQHQLAVSLHYVLQSHRRDGGQRPRQSVRVAIHEVGQGHHHVAGKEDAVRSERPA